MLNKIEHFETGHTKETMIKSPMKHYGEKKFAIVIGSWKEKTRHCEVDKIHYLSIDYTSMNSHDETISNVFEVMPTKEVSFKRFSSVANFILDRNRFSSPST